MVKEAFQLDAGAIAAYEDTKVKSMFGPLARAMLDAIEIGQEDVILDVACGTGIVGRTIHERFKPAAPITGTDINPGMVEMARRITQSTDGAFDWHVADIVKLPFEADRFTAVFCQQGMQYFPEQDAALREIRRVMNPGGTLVISLWDGASDFFVAMADAVARHVDPDVGKKYLAPFTYKGTDKLPGMLENAGFTEVERKPLVVDRVMQDSTVSVPKELFGHPAGPQVREAGEAAVQAIAADIFKACAHYQKGPDMIVPQRVNLFVAAAA